jgi:uncharacterized protein (DUF1778 family)
MHIETRTADAKGRVLLSNKLANETLLVDQLSDTEYRVRVARVIAVDEIPFLEESLLPLSDRDRDIFLAALEDTSPPNEALRKLMEGKEGS